LNSKEIKYILIINFNYKFYKIIFFINFILLKLNMFLDEINKLDIIDNIIKIPKKSIKELDRIYKEIKETEFKFIKNTSKLLNDNEKQTLYELVNSYTYSVKMENKIKSLKRINTVQYKFKNTNVNLFLYNNRLSKKIVNEILDLINFSITLFDKIHKPRENIKIYFLLTNENKTINIKKDKQLIGDNINTGYTQSFSDENNDFIVIYRMEELKKVLVHELIHLYNLHGFMSPSNIKINNFIKSTNKRFSIFEAYTETLAVLIYTYYYSKKNNEDFDKLINKQLYFSFLQSAKILYNQKINSIDDLGKKIINETTNATSYFILKCSILNNLNLYKNIFNEKDGISLLNNEKIKLFDENLIKSIKNKKFKENINKSLEDLKNNKINNILLKSFRMNILD